MSSAVRRRRQVRWLQRYVLNPPFEERALALDNARGAALVVTSAFVSTQTPLPDQSRGIWFTPPRTADQARHWLGLGATSRAVEIVLLKATPSTTPADELVDQLTGVLENPWARPDDGLLA